MIYRALISVRFDGGDNPEKIAEMLVDALEDFSVVTEADVSGIVEDGARPASGRLARMIDADNRQLAALEDAIRVVFPRAAALRPELHSGSRRAPGRHLRAVADIDRGEGPAYG